MIRPHNIDDFPQTLLTVDQVCLILGAGRHTVLKALSDGTIDGFKLGRAWRVPREKLLAYIESATKCHKEELK